MKVWLRRLRAIEHRNAVMQENISENAKAHIGRENENSVFVKS